MTDEQKQTLAKNELRAMLEASSRLYMILTHQSRTGSLRHYRILIADKDCQIEDATALVCRAIGHKWDTERGTFNVRGFLKSQDHHNLSFHIHNALKMSEIVPVHML